MENLIGVVKRAMKQNTLIPYSVYTSKKSQHLLNVPVIKPLLIVVLEGQKTLGNKGGVTLSSGDFIFISDSPETEMRNIPQGKQYLSLLIEFDYSDFEGLKITPPNKDKYIVGKADSVFQQCLSQFVEWSYHAPAHIWHMRRKEIIQLLCYMGFEKVLSMAANTKVSQKLHDIISKQLQLDLSVKSLSIELSMSESTLRRRLGSEGSSVQAIKDQVKLGHGLHLLQSSALSIGLIAEKCGYQSQSRFSDRFKHRFGLTPSALRKTRMTQ